MRKLELTSSTTSSACRMGTLAALVAAVQDATGLVNGQNMAEIDFASAGASGMITRGYAATVFIEQGKSGQYTGSVFDATANAALSAMQNVIALGITPLVYYATQYTVNSVAITFTYSQAATTNAQLSLLQLETLLLNILQGLFPVGGGQLGQVVYFSQIARKFLDLVSINGSNVSVGGLVTDVNIPAASIVTSSGTFTGDLIQPGTPGTLDGLGYLSMSTAVNPTWTAIAAP